MLHVFTAVGSVDLEEEYKRRGRERMRQTEEGLKRNEEEEGSVCALGVSPCLSLRGVMSCPSL